MKILLLIIAVIVAYCLSVCFRVAVSNPISTVKYAAIDVYKYFKYKKYNECDVGRILAYIGLFGKGKTLSAVRAVINRYKQYNDKKVYDFKRRKWVTQKVHIVSNVKLEGVPCDDFISLAQIVSMIDVYKKKDEENDTRTIHIVLGDEFSVQLNSRDFKQNIDPLFLNTLLTCRHHYIMLIYTAQRFNHVDALLRQVTSYVISCDKVWRFMVHRQYDADELEHAANPLDVKPISKFGWFIEDKHYNAYDTLACVQNLAKSCKKGDMLSEAEILALQQNTPTDMDAVQKPSRRYLHRIKKVR